MEQREKPSLLAQYLGTLWFIAMFLGALFWFGITAIDIVQQLILRPSSISLDKGAFYLLGVAMGCGVLTLAMIIEYLLKQTLSKKLNSILTKIGIFSIAIMFLLPQIVHYSIAHYLEGQGYEVCHEASHQWLHSRTIVFVDNMDVCSALVTKKK